MGKIRLDSKAALFLIPFGLALAAFFPVLFYNLVWDDAIIYSSQLPAYKSVFSAFGPPPAMSTMTAAYYRPLVFVSYMFDHSVALLFGDSLAVSDAPHWAPHATTLLAHALVSGLVALFAFRLFGEKENAASISLLAGAIFALHPVHGDSVGFASGRSDIFATFFILLALLSAMRSGVVPAILAGIFFLLSLFFKETGVTLVVLVPLMLFLKKGESFRVRLSLAVSLGIAAILYFALRLNANTWNNQIAMLEGPVGRVVSAVGFYLARSVFPWPQFLFIMEPPIGVAAACGVIAVFCAVAYFVWRKSWERRLTVFLLAWFPLTLAPSLAAALLAFSNAPMADRYLYLPSVAVSILGAVLLCGLPGRAKISATTGILVLFLVVNHIYSPLRKNDENFWGAVATQSVSSMYAMPWVSLGQINLKADRFEEARESFKKAASPEMRSNLIQSRLAVHGYAQANTELADRLLATSPGTAMELAKTAVNILQNYPLRKIDDPLALKSYAKALITLLKAEEGGGLSDPGLKSRAYKAVLEAQRFSPGDLELVGHLEWLANASK